MGVTLHRRLPIAGDLLDRLSRDHAKNASYRDRNTVAQQRRRSRQLVLLVSLVLAAIVAVVLTLVTPHGHGSPTPTPMPTSTQPVAVPSSVSA